MEWLKAILGGAAVTDGKLNINALTAAIGKELPKHTVDKEVYKHGLDKVELDEAGKVKGAEDIVKAMKEAHTAQFGKPAIKGVTPVELGESQAGGGQTENSGFLSAILENQAKRD